MINCASQTELSNRIYRMDHSFRLSNTFLPLPKWLYNQNMRRSHIHIYHIGKILLLFLSDIISAICFA